MDDCEGFIKATLPEKEDYYYHLNMNNTTDAKKIIKILK